MRCIFVLQCKDFIERLRVQYFSQIKEIRTYLYEWNPL